MTFLHHIHMMINLKMCIWIIKYKTTGIICLCYCCYCFVAPSATIISGDTTNAAVYTVLTIGIIY